MIAFLPNCATGAGGLGAEADRVNSPLLDGEGQIVDVVDAGVEEQVLLQVLAPRNTVVGGRDEAVQRAAAVRDADAQVREAVELVAIGQDAGGQERLNDEAQLVVA